MNKIKKISKNEIFTKVVNDRTSMIAINTSYAAIIFAAIADAPLFLFAGVALVIGNTKQAYRKAIN